MAENTTTNVAQVFDCTIAKNDLCLKFLRELTGTRVKEDDHGVCWKVDNRYYSADITVQRLSVGEASPVEESDCEAVVFLYAWNESEGFEKVKKIWESLSNVNSPSVCLLVCSYSGEMDDTHYDQVTRWCVESGFELVEWNHGNQPIDDDDLDKQGVARVSDALQAHMWPQMTMKKQNGDSDTTAVNAPSNGTSSSDPTPEMSVQQILSRGLGNHGDPGTDDVTDLTGEESFEELFGRFAEMKTHAESLPHQDRKDYAEKVVMAFWQAIGGDEDEFKD